MCQCTEVARGIKEYCNVHDSKNYMSQSPLEKFVGGYVSVNKGGEY